jgi:uncharacterized protein YfaP (DUF2135 family)
MLTEELIETDLATSDQSFVEKLFDECLSAWDATGQVTSEIGSLATKLLDMSGLSKLGKKAVTPFFITTARAANDDPQAAAIANTLSAEDSIARCTQLGSQLSNDVNVCASNVRRMQNVYNGRNTSVSDWQAATADTANCFGTNVFVSGEISSAGDSVPSSNSRSVRTLTNSMKSGGLVLDNADIVIDVGREGSTIVMGQGNGVSMNRDELGGCLNNGDSSVITICTYPEDPNDIGITFHGTGLDSWLIVGRVGGFRITRGDKEEDILTPPEVEGGSINSDGMDEESIRNSFPGVTGIEPPENTRQPISDWTPPLGVQDINDTRNRITADSAATPTPAPTAQPGPVDVGTMTERLIHEGAQSGTITVSMLWGTHDDIDLHMITPDNKHIYYSNKTAGGGTLDVDMNAGSSNLSTSPVENIYFPEPADGHYKIYIRDYRDRTEGQSSHYLVRVIVNGQERLFEGEIDGTGTEIVIFEFDYVAADDPTNNNEPQPPTEQDLTDWLNEAGAGHGDITVSLAWNSWDDVDLHMNAPENAHIYYSCKSAGGGILDVDANAGSQRILNPVENIYFASPKNGHYKVWLKEYNDRTSDSSTEYIVRVTVGDQSQTFSGTIDSTGTEIPILEFDYNNANEDGQISWNGHRYAFYDDGGSMSWTQARSYCQGLGGHLVTIGSAEEQAFVETLFTAKYPWIGLYGSENGWNWVTGETVDYTHWRSSQPDNANGDEWYVHLWDGPWNDLNNDDSTYHYHSGFVCEWDSLIDLNEQTLTQGLTEAGALTGEITISVAWDSADDIDLHVFTPSGAEIYYDNTHADGGTLDVDANRYSDDLAASPIENIYFADPTAGEYWIYIYDYEDRSPGTATNYYVRLMVGEQSQTFTGTIDGSDTTVEVSGFRYGQ